MVSLGSDDGLAALADFEAALADVESAQAQAERNQVDELDPAIYGAHFLGPASPRSEDEAEIPHVLSMPPPPEGDMIGMTSRSPTPARPSQVGLPGPPPRRDESIPPPPKRETSVPAPPPPAYVDVDDDEEGIDAHGGKIVRAESVGITDEQFRAVVSPKSMTAKLKAAAAAHSPRLSGLTRPLSPTGRKSGKTVSGIASLSENIFDDDIKDGDDVLVKKASFTAMLRQVDIGLDMLDTMKEVLRKFGKHQQQYSTKLLEVLGRLPAQYTTMDGIKDLADICDMCHSLILETVKAEKKLGDFITTKMVPRMAKYVQDKQQMVQSIKKSNHQAELKFNNAVSAMKKAQQASKAAALKAREARAAAGSTGAPAAAVATKSSATSSWKSFSKKMVKYAASTTGVSTGEAWEAEAHYKKARDLDQKHEAAVMTANHEQDVYEHIAIRFKKRFREIEAERIEFMRTQSETFLTQHLAFFTNDNISSLCAQLDFQLKKLDRNDALDVWLDGIVTKFGDAQDMKQVFRYTSADYQNAFNSLQDAMDITLKLKPDHTPENVPLMMSVLCEKIVELKGFQTEGIFRISAASSDLDKLRDELSSHNYKYVETCSDAHIPAGMLKMWLRGLSDSLIPQTHYEIAIAMAKEPKKLTHEALEVFLSQLPIVNRESIKYLVKFLQQLLKPDNVTITLMNVENVAIVFAPTILKCPSDDPTILMQNSKFEKDFTVQLLTKLL